MATGTTITIPVGEHAPLAMQLLAASDQPWAITPRAIRAMIRASDHPDFGAAYDALAARVGKSLPGGNGDVEVHGSTAVLDIRGPLFRYRSIWTWLLGGTAVEDASIGLHAALDDPGVKSIVLTINSPGGQVDGVNELANMIRAANAVKPVTAYVDSLAASGAYWLAAAAGKIVADETAQLGSIGVLATVVDDSAAEEKRGIKRFDIVSSQSPLKRADPGTDEGRAQLQQMVDALAQVFIEKVAKFRGTSAQRVQRDFGQGGVMSAQAAITVGMADALGSLQDLLGGEAPNTLVRDIRDRPGLRVAVLNTGATTGSATTTAAAPFDEQELEDGTDETELNNDPTNCPGSPGDAQCQEDDEEDDEDESQGTEQEPDASSIPEGVGVQMMTPTEERQRIAAILNCEEAKGREQLARMLALETDNTVDAAKKILVAAPVATATNALETRMNALPNPNVGVPGEQQDDESPAAEVKRILAFVPKGHLRSHARVQ